MLCDRFFALQILHHIVFSLHCIDFQSRAMREMSLAVELRHAITGGSGRRNSRGGVGQLQSVESLQLFGDGCVQVLLRM